MSETSPNNKNSTPKNYLEQAAILLLCIGEEAAATVMQKLSREVCPPAAALTALAVRYQSAPPMTSGPGFATTSVAAAV